MISLTRYFYRRCIQIDNKAFVDAVIESITYLLFHKATKSVYTILKPLSTNSHCIRSISLNELKMEMKESNFQEQVKMARRLRKIHEPRLALIQMATLERSIACVIKSERNGSDYTESLHDYGLVEMIIQPVWQLSTAAGLVSTDELLAGLIYALVMAHWHYEDGKFLLEIV